MPTGQTEYGDVNPETAGYLSKKFLERALEYMPFEPFVSGITLPANETKTLRFRRWVGDWDAAVENMYLAEGVVPTAQQVTMEDVTVTLSQMGGLTKLTDVIEDTHTDPVLNQMYDILSEQAPRIIELDRYYTLRAATSKYYSNGSARGNVNTAITTNLLKKIIRFLQRNSALPITKYAKTTPDYDTANLNPCWIAIGHIDLQGDIEGLSGFIPARNYPTHEKVFEGEPGSWQRIRFILSPMVAPYKNSGGAKGTMVSTGGTSADVYPLFIFGKNAWDSVALKGKFAVKPMVVNPGNINQANPLAQFGYCSWKTMQKSVITSDDWCAVAEVAATELS